MPTGPRIALIHATRVAIDPIELAVRELWPQAETVSILDEGLSADRASGRASLETLNARIVTLARYAEGMKPDGILYTCSAFGRGIEEAAATSELPVLKPNEAAFDHGTDIAMIYTLPPAVTGMEEEFAEEAARRGSQARLRSIHAGGALEALRAGDADAHNQLIAQAAQEIGTADAILLAHFSMARAAHSVRSMTDIPVLSSPETAIRKLQAALTQRPE